MGHWSPVQQAIECADQAATASGAYNAAAASRHTQAASNLKRFGVEAVTLFSLYNE